VRSECILDHGPEGAFGLVVNRPVSGTGTPFPLYAGGPCPSDGVLMLHGHPDWAQSDDGTSAKEVAPGVFLGDSSCLEYISNAAGEELRYRMFRGYAGWGPGQLEGELAAGAWAIVQAKADTLFDTPIDQLWHHLSPPAIPQPSVN